MLVSLARMWGWLLYANMCLSLLVLLPGSQQHLFSWAPMLTFGILLSWGLTGFSLAVIHNQHLLENPRQMVLYPLQIWVAFVCALRPPLAEAVLLLPICTTAALIHLTAGQNRRTPELPLHNPRPLHHTEPLHNPGPLYNPGPLHNPRATARGQITYIDRLLLT